MSAILRDPEAAAAGAARAASAEARAALDAAIAAYWPHALAAVILAALLGGAFGYLGAAGAARLIGRARP